MARTFSSQRLRDARLARGLKPEALALRIDRSVWSIHQYERGTVTPPAPILGVLADQLDCTVDDFFALEAVTTDAA
ncbi:helix-turn-helix transcriptional regulator [Actinoplanes sp. NPDC048791]|uniref:helix-turn-helix transcriptional regulator n=1 Tax=Actinoplanes sp. NPDC048791 TaxID=3154623 RepID=UPI003409904E